MMQDSTVGELMTREVVTLHEEDSLESVLQAMESLQVRHVPVVDGQRLVGLVTHRDLLRLIGGEIDQSPAAHARRERGKANVFVSKVMTRDPLTARPETSIADAAQALVQGRFGCLPVVDDDKTLVGILTATDVLSWVIACSVLDNAPPSPPGADVRPLSIPPVPSDA